jgi:hypothetical protein
MNRAAELLFDYRRPRIAPVLRHRIFRSRPDLFDFIGEARLNWRIFRPYHQSERRT